MIARYSLLGVSLFFLLALITACDSNTATDNKKNSTKNSSKWSQYIASHTSGAISKNAAIRIRFVNDIISEDKVAADASNVLIIEPAISGTTTFANKREIVVQPTEALVANSKYQVTVKSEKLLGLQSTRDDFTFSFQIIRQDFELTINGLSTDQSNNQQLVLNGTINTADSEQDETIENMLRAQYQNNDINIQWQHINNGKQHAFKIPHISRQKTSSALTLRWDATIIGIKQQGKQDINIPAVGEFSVTKIRAIQADRQYVELQFSDPLNSNQDLNGLIQLKGIKFSSRVEGNTIKLYPSSPLKGAVSVVMEAGIKNNKGIKFSQRLEQKVFFSTLKPQVRFVGKGVILPDNKILSIPFEAVNVSSVQVTAFRVFDNNIGQFLHSNKLDGKNNLHFVGRYLWRKTIPLSSASAEGDKWNRYSLDATELLRANPGGLFRLTLSINRGNSSFSCAKESDTIAVEKEAAFKNHDDLIDTSNSGWGYAEQYYAQDGSTNWADRSNPCKDAYYKHASGVSASRNFMASNIGIIAKRDKHNHLSVITTDIRTSEPLPGVSISLFNFQGQEMSTMITDPSGFAKSELSNIPFYIVAEKDQQKGYLKVSKGVALATSHFNIGGQQVKKGLKGFVYGERGVWRPGDNIYLTFVLQDKENTIPSNHPVTMRLYSPKGKLVQTLSNNKPVGDFYAFKLKTSDDAPTGTWTAKAQLGGNFFVKKLKIETVTPNRLKIEMDFGKQQLNKNDMPFSAKLFSQWLHGAKASRLKYAVEVKMRPRKTRFDLFNDFIFDDPARSFRSKLQIIAEGKLDEKGFATVNKSLQVNSEAPGMLTAQFTTRVFEQGGDFSSDSVTIPYAPYDNFIGIKLPKGDAARNMLLTDVKHIVEVASLTANGEKISLNQIELTLYKINWKWWWDKSGDSLARYSSSYQTSFIQQSMVATDRNGQGSWEFEVKYPDWGRYLIRACDQTGKHCTGKTLYIDWPGWAGRAGESSGAGANTLSVTTDKANYKVGDTAIIRLPEASQGRALLTIETGTQILQQRWLTVSKDSSRFELSITADMAPNVYAHVSLLQPHQNKKNDRPIRLYGVIPLLVEDPDTRLSPVLTTADEWKPRSKVSVSIAESQGKAMTYTIAVVDEGLLGLTRFKTPDLHKQFYRKEALGVITWDMFDQVVGAYGGELERLLALGGDAEAEADDQQKDKKRFPPVVKFLGPFKLEAGKNATHSFTLPQYIGALRVMVVAGDYVAYGKTSKSVFVRESLGMLATVPRVIGPDEEMTLPVALFVMEDSIKDVKLEMEVDDHFEIIGDASQNIHFETQGDKLGILKLKVKPGLGKGHIRFIASSGKFKTETEVYIDIRSANPSTVRQSRKAIAPGESWSSTITPHGIKNTNTVTLELSSVPPINLSGRLDYLIRYPHGCIEQVTSSVFPQLYLSRLVKLDNEAKQSIDKNVNAGINRLLQFQNPNGSFSYWPSGSGTPSPWGSNYAGHFLLQAQTKGYHLPPGLLSNWLAYQANTAKNWLAGSGRSELEQAYRLYTLALANKAEMGAMNRLRESTTLSNIARWQLASAYQLAGQADAANELLLNTNKTMAEYSNEGITFGSKLRDQAIVLNTLVAMGRKSEAKQLADTLSVELSSDKWHSTQTVAWSLLAFSQFIGSDTLQHQFNFMQQRGKGAKLLLISASPIYKQTLKDYPISGDTLLIKNNSAALTLYANVTVQGIPKAGVEQSVAQGLSIDVNYYNSNGKRLDVSQLTQGSDIVAKVSISNNTRQNLTNLSLTHIVPSGWQILNQRYNKNETTSHTANSNIDYQDIRDDRVYSYFSLKAAEKKQFTVLLNASYLGRFYLPGISVAAMYDASKHARTKGLWVNVVKSAN